MRRAAELILDGEPDAVPRARRLTALLRDQPEDLLDDVELVIAELTTNALLHGVQPVAVRVFEDDGCIRVEVGDRGHSLPVLPRTNTDAMTGRGFAMVTALARSWGVDPSPEGGKVVWAEVCAGDDRTRGGAEFDINALLAKWADKAGRELGREREGEVRHTVQLGGVPTELLLAAKSHIDDVVRELRLMQAEGSIATGTALPEPVLRLISSVTQDFAEARGAIKRQALEAASRGELVTELSLHLPLSAADAGERYLAALDEIDRWSRAARLLTLAPPRSHQVFRRWYLRALIDQLRARGRGEEPVPPPPFPQVLAVQVDLLSASVETQSRLDLLQSVARELAEAESIEEMASVVVERAAAYGGVETARVFTLQDNGTLRSIAWHGGPPGSQLWEEFSVDAEVPAAVVVRTGEPLHARSLAELYAQFPEFGREELYPRERSLHVVPLTVAGNVIGLLALTFRAGEVGDDAQLDFVRAIADSLAQAIERAHANERAAAERRRELALLSAQVEALAGVVNEQPLVLALDRLLLAVETASFDAMIVSVLLMDDDGLHLRHGSAPSLPAEYNAAIDGVAIGPAVGSCGTAAYLREQVIVEDIAVDPRWADYRELAARAGLRACWSTPIFASTGKLLGTFALYYRQPRGPSESDLAFIDVMVSTAALIIERSGSDGHGGRPQLQDEAAQRLALELAVSAGGVGTFDWDLVSGALVWDERLLEIFGIEGEHRRVVTIEDFYQAVHPGDRARVSSLLQEAIDEVGEYDAEYRILLPDGNTRWVAARGKALTDRAGVTVRLVGAAQDTTARRDAEGRIARVMDSLSTAFFFLDTEWRFNFLNAEAERVLARRREDLLGEVIWEQFPAAAGSDFELYYRRAAETGEPVAFDAFYPEPLHAWYEVRAWPSPDGLAVYFIDVTDRRTAESAAQRAIGRAGLLAKVSEELAGTLDADKAIRSLAQIIVPALGEWCVVTLIDDDRHVGTRKGLGYAVGWHADAARRDLADHYAKTRLHMMSDDALVVRAVETAEPQIVNGDAIAALRPMFTAGSEPLRILEELDTYAVAILPLVGQEQPVGMVSVCNTTARGPFSAEDIDLLREIAARAGLVLDRARLYRQQRAVAEGLQRSLLQPPPASDHVDLAVRYVPAAEVAQVGGDWYDAYHQPDGSSVLIIGDVMGHDLLAAAAMGEARTLVRTLAAQLGGDPARVLSDAERAMRLLQLDTLATVLVGRLEPASATAGEGARRFRFSNAGHPPPLLVGEDGTVSVLEQEFGNPLLGVGVLFRTEDVVVLEPEATIVLYTDGLVERRGQSLEDGINRLRQVLTELAGADPEDLCDGILARMMPERPEDDVALLVAKLRPLQPTGDESFARHQGVRVLTRG